MTHTIIFSKEINEDNIYELIDKLEDLKLNLNEINKSENNDTELRLYFLTVGGDICFQQILSHYLNNYPCKIKLVISGECFSSGMDFLCDFYNGDIEILYTAYGMYHYPDTRVSLKNLNNQYSIDDFIYKKYWNDLVATTNKNMQKMGLTKEEIKIILSRKDLYFDNERLRDIIKNISEYNKKHEVK